MAVEAQEVAKPGTATGPKRRSHTGLATAGLLAGTSGLGFLVGSFTGGRWGDRHGHRRVALVASTAAASMSSIVSALSTGLFVRQANIAQSRATSTTADDNPPQPSNMSMSNVP